jgi:hypothetical protein
VAEDTRTGLVERLRAYRHLPVGMVYYGDAKPGECVCTSCVLIREAAAALASAEEREKALTADRDEARQGLAQQIDLLHAAVEDATDARAERDALKEALARAVPYIEAVRDAHPATAHDSVRLLADISALSRGEGRTDQ